MHMYIEVRKETLKRKQRKKQRKLSTESLALLSSSSFLNMKEKVLMKGNEERNYSIIGSKMIEITIGDFRVFNFEIMK